MPPRYPLRWAAIAVITFSSLLNYLDRQLLPALAPQLREEFGLSNADYGLILSVFSVTYAVCAPLAGWTIDRLGLSRGIVLVVGLWSVAGIGTGLAGGLAGLMILRSLLGLAQAGGVPATGKAAAQYLPPEERALGTAATQVGLSLGAMGAPLVAGAMAGWWGWRSAFVATGALGFLWIPLWMLTARRVKPVGAPPAEPAPRAGDLLRDSRLWGLVAANMLCMTLYSLWSNWTTVFLVEERGMAPDVANRTLAWIPPLISNAGGLCGGWLARRWMRGGASVAGARLRVITVSSVFLVATAAVPLAPGAWLATAFISASFFWVTAMSVNVYAVPLDLFGAGRAALATSALTGAYGAMQAVISPLVGTALDHYGFGPVCLVGSTLPLAAAGVLRWTILKP